MDLAELMRQLIQEEGLSPQDAARVAAAAMKAAKNTNSSLSVRNRNSVQKHDDENYVSPDSWKLSEKQREDGQYFASSAGIFGSGPIVFEDYEPENESKIRTEALLAQATANKQTQRLLELLQEGIEESRATRSRRELDSPGDSRQLGRKRER